MEEEFNPLTHMLVPEHRLATPEEVAALLKRYNITLEQLPKILSSDPCAMMIGARPGDVVKILRRSQTAGISLAFRYVVEG